MSASAAVVPDYEVFRNQKNALAFFFFRHPVLDQNASEGPFWFNVKEDSIEAGTESHHVVFEKVEPDVLSTAKQRGVIMMIEFEKQQPVRCTPCYLAEKF